MDTSEESTQRPRHELVAPKSMESVMLCVIVVRSNIQKPLVVDSNAVTHEELARLHHFVVDQPRGRKPKEHGGRMDF